MFHFFRKPPESKKPSVPETEADGFVLLEASQRLSSDVLLKVLTLGQTLWVGFVAPRLTLYPWQEIQQMSKE
ncbi:UMAD1 isoform 2 [Pan troglodytes]|uniref:UBAP1-MVB12-associated (UMA) domain containing 1 n=4 Tax=Homininae TaxID=207598 RepID=A0A1B0GWD2_HUMAN|nr:UBAP1-MVB12-associated (UMA) domain containing 1 [Homo sapiens]KAI4012910.1 UBAP1-MVB12-associated (UMA) domain containing 1 [Homo sapiens]PNI57832.1 UMAD1 isoform 2 [Pan troglodytes]